MTQFLTIIGLILAFFSSVLIASISVFTFDYKCEKVKVSRICDLDKQDNLELRIYSITQRNSPLIGTVTGNCIFTVGEGKNLRYAMTNATFSPIGTEGRLEYFQHAEFPVKQSRVCRVE